DAPTTCRPRVPHAWTTSGTANGSRGHGSVAHPSLLDPATDAEPSGAARPRGSLTRRSARLRHLRHGLEPLRVVGREVGEHATVELDAGLLQPADKRAVAEAVHASRRVDARDPELAERALLHLAIAVRVRERLLHAHDGNAVEP